MTNYKQFHDAGLVYIISPGEAAIQGMLDKYKVTSDMEKWYKEINKYGYLVQCEEKIGFLYVVEESHTGLPSGVEKYKMAVAHGNRTPGSVWQLVCEVANILAEQPLDVFVKKYGGVYKQHKLGVFLPYGTDKSMIMQTIEVINETMKEVALKKWNSLVDLVIYD